MRCHSRDMEPTKARQDLLVAINDARLTIHRLNRTELINTLTIQAVTAGEGHLAYDIAITADLPDVDAVRAELRVLSARYYRALVH
jgi:hypothetical protein